MKNVLAWIVAIAAVLLLAWGALAVANWWHASAVNLSVHEVEGYKYLVVVGPGGVAVCPMVAP